MEKTNLKLQNRTGMFLAAVVTALVLVFLCSSVLSAAMIPIKVETTKDNLNIRSEADTYSDILTVIEKSGTFLYPVEDVSANWYKVRFADGVYGYVYKEYVKPAGSFTASVNLLSGGALRVSPVDIAPVQKLCSIGTELSVSGMDSTGKWYYATSFNGESGYIKTTSVADLGIEYPSASRPLEEVEKITLVEMDSSSGKIRKSASTSSEQLAVMERGTLLSVIGETRGTDGYTWYKVKFDGGKVGYVRSDIVKAYDTSHLKGKIIVLDPGHGCYSSQKNMDLGVYDNGNIGVSGSLEKDINLIIARYLQTYLKEAGATVIMTRETDVGLLTLTDRANIGNNAKADAFVSIHINFSTTNKNKTGVITYYWPDSNSSARAKLAASLQNASYIELGAEDLGTPNNERFAVLYNTTVPSALIELGYMSNADEEKLLLDPDYQMCCAQGVYKGLLKYFE
ncbi:MAG: N-acetylmuramoyl-L-alanine amidase [Firmicutes bacterium]|nr:N-acetylmuramoyl-L-alanine amidase [Bacillota bacterium]